MPAPGTGLRIPETTRAKRPAKANRRVPETKCTHETRRLAGQLPNLRNAWFEWECVVDLRGLELRARHAVVSNRL